ncbi:MAG: SAM-dependent methyltransferase, partial [Chryseolinea sp.]
AEYSTILERHGFRVILMEHFGRPTPLKGVNGIKDWFKMFGDKLFTDIPEPVKEDILNEVQIRLEPTHLLDGVWIADYKRIRAIAIKE